MNLTGNRPENRPQHRAQSRWSAWAAQIRGRHRHDAARRLSAPMVLTRHITSVTQVVQATRQTLIRVDARLGITQVLMVPIALGRATAMAATAPAMVVQRQRATDAEAVPANRPPAWRRADAPAAPMTESTGALRFVDGAQVRSVRAIRQQHEAQREAALPALVERWRRGSPVATEARATPARLWRGGTRQDLPIGEQARVIVAARRGATESAPPGRPHEAAETSPMRGVGMQGAPAMAPAISVEALTSQVIQQLDRRLVAYRERMGKS